MEQVVLVDSNNQEIGLADKANVHSKNTPLHRGFSLWLFNSGKEVLLTQRALSKKTFPGVWSNTLCGHPGPGEKVIDAAHRRLDDEFKIKNLKLKIIEVAPYKYKFSDQNGILENEICPILVAYINNEDDDNFTPNPEEINDWQWLPWYEFLEKIFEDPKQFSPWSVEEAMILKKILKL